MTLKFIDVASYQAGLDLSKIQTDGVIIKATEGVAYVNPYCNDFFQQGLKLGKMLGVIISQGMEVEIHRKKKQIVLSSIQRDI